MRKGERKEKKGGRENRETCRLSSHLYRCFTFQFNEKKKKEKKCLFEMYRKKNWQGQVV